MIQIDASLCTACGACAEACPRQAISIGDGVAQVADEVCDNCGRCEPVCPSDAILWVDVLPLGAAVGPLAAPEPVALGTELRVPVRAAAVWPMLGSALLWAGREIVPWVADLALDMLMRRGAGRTTATRISPITTRLGQSGRRHRQRQRKQGIR